VVRGYLQRLADRAAGPQTAAPALRSDSPLMQADQRLGLDAFLDAQFETAGSAGAGALLPGAPSPAAPTPRVAPIHTPPAAAAAAPRSAPAIGAAASGVQRFVGPAAASAMAGASGVGPGAAGPGTGPATPLARLAPVVAQDAPAAPAPAVQQQAPAAALSGPGAAGFLTADPLAASPPHGPNLHVQVGSTRAEQPLVTRIEVPGPVQTQWRLAPPTSSPASPQAQQAKLPQAQPIPGPPGAHNASSAQPLQPPQLPPRRAPGSGTVQVRETLRAAAPPPPAPAAPTPRAPGSAQEASVIGPLPAVQSVRDRLELWLR
jgi:hypothetical protein